MVSHLGWRGYLTTYPKGKEREEEKKSLFHFFFCFLLPISKLWILKKRNSILILFLKSYLLKNKEIYDLYSSINEEKKKNKSLKERNYNEGKKIKMEFLSKKKRKKKRFLITNKILKFVFFFFFFSPSSSFSFVLDSFF